MHVTKKIRPGIKVVVVHNRRALLVQRGPHEGGSCLWELPGGGLEFGERVIDCLSRELQEETGLRAQVDDILGAETALLTQDKQLFLVYYLAHSASDRVTLSREHQAFVWADMARMRQLLHRPIVADFDRWRIWDKLGPHLD